MRNIIRGMEAAKLNVLQASDKYISGGLDRVLARVTLVYEDGCLTFRYGHVKVTSSIFESFHSGT